ncbi:hypothetical protein K1719_044440 [Acacia pycnantha]|nr:hypothetical protein K1719_044440 [Acacia pycnantha]
MDVADALSFYSSIVIINENPTYFKTLNDSHLQARQSLASHSNLQTYLRSIFIYHAQREEPWTEDPILVTSVMRTRVRALENAMNAELQQQNHDVSLGSTMVDTFPSSKESKPALETLVEHRITGFPVIDDDWNLFDEMLKKGLSIPDIATSHQCCIYI